MGRQAIEDQRRARVRLGMPIMLACFGSACSLVSRSQVGDASGGLWMLVLGIALQVVVACALFFAVPSKAFRWWGAVANIVVVGVLSAVLTVRCALGDDLRFMTAQLFLVAGMAYQVVAAAQSARRGQAARWRTARCLVLGAVVLGLSVGLTEGIASALLASGMDARGILGCSCAAFAFSALVLLAKSGRCLKDCIREGFREDAAGDLPGRLSVDLHGATEPPKFEEAQATWEEALDRRLAQVGEEFGLTAREQEVLGYLARGYSVPAAAECLYLSPGTVKSHVARVYRKLGVSSRREALVILLDEGRRIAANEDSAGAQPSRPRSSVRAGCLRD